MLIRRQNWTVVLTIAILGPLLGAFFGATFLPVGPSPDQTTRPTVTDGTPGSLQAEPEDCKDAPTVRAPDGDRMALNEIAPTRAVAIVVMKGTWCPVCQRQLKRLSRQLHRVQSAGATVVGLTDASPETNARLMEKLDLTFPIMSDASKDLLESLGMWRAEACHAIPGVILLDESGTVVDIHRGRYPGKPQDQFVIDRLRHITE